MNNIANIKTDKEGFLLNLDDWNKELAIELARVDGIELSQEHWDVINFLRKYFMQYQMSPAIRIVIKEMSKQFGQKRGNSIYLYSLFPLGPIKQGCKFAGLPKPSGCI
jgi:tRNA 2-thiouridine synthesizing protein E